MLLSCTNRNGSNPGPENPYARAEYSFQHGDLPGAQQEAEANYERLLALDPKLAGRFRLLQVQAMLARGIYKPALAELSGSPPNVFASCELLARKYSLEAFAYSQLGNPTTSQEKLRQAESECPMPDPILAADLSIRRGTLEGSAVLAEKDYLTALYLAHQEHDTYREAIALLNLGNATLNQERYDQSIEWNQSSLRISHNLGYKRIEEKAQGNLAFDYGKLGDFEQAAILYREAEQSSRALDAGDDRIIWRNDLGMIREQTGQLDLAESDYNQALSIAREQGVKSWITITLGELAFVSTRIGKWGQAKDLSGQALESALQDENRPVELEALLVQALVGSHDGDKKTAEKLLSEVARDPGHDRQSLRWEAQAALANLYAEERRASAAKAEYQLALDTVRIARCSVNREDLRLPFLANASRVYNSYIDFLVQQGKIADALRTADESRALTLAEGLRVDKQKCLASETVFNPQRTAKAANATILFYWLGAAHSYLWAVAPDRLKLYPLPPAAEIQPALQAYRKALLGSRDVLEAGDANGAALYQALVAPAEEFFHDDARAKGQRVIVITDGSLSGLNFETLIDRKPTPHYWIEDVTRRERLIAASTRCQRRKS